MFALADPWALLLLAVPLAVWALPGRRPRAGAALSVPDGIATRLASLSGAEDQGTGRGLLPLAIWACLVVALAGPRLLEESPALPVSGRDLVLALDLSGSMTREDFYYQGEEIQRLDAVKLAATDFVRKRAGDRVALVAFGSKAYFATPQTFDVEAVADAVGDATLGIVGRATGISEGLGMALKRLSASEAESKVVILLSDGVNNAGPVKPREAARLAADLGVRVHTIAFGPRDLANAEGERDAVDAVTLEAIAKISGGAYFRVRTTEDMLRVAGEIDRLEANDTDGPSALLHRELWIWPALLAVLLTAGLLIREARE